MSVLRTIAVALVLAVAAPGAGRSADRTDVPPWIDMPKSRVRLVAGTAKTAAGGYLAGLEMVMAEGWHTYWRMPGDAGVPPTFDWSGSTNVRAIEVLYPAPTRMSEAGVEIIGYKDAVLFPIEVTPEDAAQPVALKLSLEYGICREICIPAATTLELSLAPARSGSHADAIAAALERVPRPHEGRRRTDPELRHVAVDGDGATPRLTIEVALHGSKGGDVFVEAPAGFYVPLPRQLAEAPSGIVRYGSDLSSDMARDLSGKTLTLTMVSQAGATEAQWTFP